MLLVLIVPNWTKEFHVHIVASNYAIGTMLALNPNDTINKPIYYANRLMTEVEKNYSTTDKEAFMFIYIINFFCHHLLGNNFMLFVDHQVLIYLINKPTIIGQIVWWLLLLQKVNFKVIYKLGKKHFVPNQLSQTKNGGPNVGSIRIPNFSN